MLLVMDERVDIGRVRSTDLDAWPVVSSLLFDVANSDDVVSIVGLAGLNVDWSVTKEQAFSHSTRKRAYRPRVHAAFSALTAEDRVTALSLIVAEVVRRFPAQSQTARAALQRIGWTVSTAHKASSYPKTPSTPSSGRQGAARTEGLFRGAASPQFRAANSRRLRAWRHH